MTLHKHAEDSYAVIGSPNLGFPLTSKEDIRLNLCFNVFTPEQMEKIEYNFQDISLNVEQAKSLKAQLNNLKILE